MSKLNWEEGARRIAIVLSVVAIIFWTIVWLVGGDLLSRLGVCILITAVTIGIIWAVYILAVFVVPYVVRGFTGKKPE